LNGGFAFYVPEGLYYGDNGDDGLVPTGLLIAAADDLNGYKGPHTVMYSHHTLSLIGNQRQSVLDGVEAGGTTIGQQVKVSPRMLRREGEGVLLAQ
jgi:hypothetical protein